MATGGLPRLSTGWEKASGIRLCHDAPRSPESPTGGKNLKRTAKAKQKQPRGKAEAAKAGPGGGGCWHPEKHHKVVPREPKRGRSGDPWTATTGQADANQKLTQHCFFRAKFEPSFNQMIPRTTAAREVGGSGD